MQEVLGRPHAQRLRHDLDEIRAELVQAVNELTPGGFDWAPRPDMRSCKQLLQEVGAMEALSRRWVTHRELPDWEATSQALGGEDAPSTLSALEGVRSETLEYLDRCTEEQLETPIPIPEEWRQYFEGTSEIEPEELLRWVARHEYYHVGQLNTYGFLRAANGGLQSGA
uniref:DinB-like domain-containing protein n=1 Tax=uncultured Armatimonadetes bacterium TaxID=157466 RepID=A0A6J4J3T4_9BACT|nr:hypothetical protein AVDCRST_MAG63-2749 [uncultured Armatimonadetes bacterium]